MPIVSSDQIDTDADGIPDLKDNCPDLSNPNQADKDGDKIGDACDNCPNEIGDAANKGCPKIQDTDNDGIAQTSDNCPDISNPNQYDRDGDKIGDACDDCPDEKGDAANKGCPPPAKAETGSFTDPRDKQSYRWVRLKDGKKWMAENLNHITPDSWCYDTLDSNCDKYGRLYTWDAAKKACPKGWRLPSDEEWWQMASYYGKAYNSWDGKEKNSDGDAGEEAYKLLMTGGSSGFSALLGGYRGSDGSFGSVGGGGSYWSSTEEDSSSAWRYRFHRSSSSLGRYDDGKSWGFSCRCIQD